MLPFALLLAVAGTYLLFDAEPGINWGIWATLLATGILAAQWSQFGRVGRTTAGLCALGVAFAWGLAVTASGPLIGFDILAAFAVFALAVQALPDENAAHLSVRRLVRDPIVAPFAGTAEAGRRLQDAVIAARREEALPVLRGAAIAIPAVAGFGLALSAADPVFASWRHGVASVLTDLPVGRAAFGAILFVACLGALGLVARGARRGAEPRQGARPLLYRLSVTERLIPLASIVALFACFLVLQVSYLFGNAPAVAGSGITFAEYARRGFGELTVVTMTCGGLLVLLRGGAERPGDARVLRVLEIAVVAELTLLLASAFRRVVLYEEAYGYTIARVWAQAFMVTLAAGLLVLGRELAGAFDVHRLVRRQAALGTALLLALTYWNHEAWITRRNVARFERIGRLDLSYLARGLSANAVPAVLDAARRVGGVRGVCADLHIREGWADAEARGDDAWHEWSIGRRRAYAAAARAPWYELPEPVRQKLLSGGCGSDWSIG